MMNPQTNEQIDALYSDPKEAHGMKMLSLNLQRVFTKPDFLYNGAPGE